MRLSERGCSHPSTFTVVVMLAALVAIGHAVASWLGLPTVWSWVVGVLWWPTLVLVVCAIEALALWIRDSVVQPRRMRRLLDRIDSLDANEAPDEAFEAALLELAARARGIGSDRYLPRIRIVLLSGDGKSRLYLLRFLVKCEGDADSRRLLGEVAGRWDDPLSFHARKLLARRTTEFSEGHRRREES